MNEISYKLEMILTVISGMRVVAPSNAEEVAYNNALGDVFDYIIKNEAEHLEPHTLRCGLWVRDNEFSRDDKEINFLETKIDSSNLISNNKEKNKARAIYVGFSSHDCEAHYKCPKCNKHFGSWTVFNQKPNDNNTKHYCPQCKTELEGLE